MEQKKKTDNPKQQKLEITESELKSIKKQTLDYERTQLDLKEKTKLLEEKENSYLRLAAEFDNHKKRTQETLRKSKEDGAVDVIEKILPLVDTLGFAKNSVSCENTLKGLCMIERQFVATLKEFGVEQQIPLGELFDPKVHSAVSNVKAEKAADKGKIVEVVRPGYKIGGRIIRHASVVVATQ